MKLGHIMLCINFFSIETFLPESKREAHETEEVNPIFKFGKAETSKIHKSFLNPWPLYLPPQLPAAQGKVELGTKVRYTKHLCLLSNYSGDEKYFYGNVRFIIMKIL